MSIQNFKDHLIDASSAARRLYGIKLSFFNRHSDASRWFLFDLKSSIYELNLEPEGLVLDFGAYLGEYTEELQKRNPRLNFWLFEPIPEFSEVCVRKFKKNPRVVVHERAISEDGRDFQMHIDKLRSRSTRDTFQAIKVRSIGIQDIFDSVTQIELMKMNIEGMEYECLNQLIKTKSLNKTKHLLIQFHKIDEISLERRNYLRKQMAEEFDNVYTFEWIWELWIRKEK